VRDAQGQQWLLPWAVDAVTADTLHVPVLAPPALPAALPPDPLLLLGRDVLDALVLDLRGVRAVRANGLWLRVDAEGCRLVGIDISARAVLHRLVPAPALAPDGAGCLDWRDVECLHGDPGTVAQHAYQRAVATLPAPQVADLAAALPYPHAAELLALLPPALAARVLERLPAERQTQVITSLTLEQAVVLLSAMAPDLAADVLGHLAVPDAARLLRQLPPDCARRVQALLQYPPDSAGGIMTNLLVTAPVDRTVAEVIAHIRPQLTVPDFVYYVYLVDATEPRRLRGVVGLRDLLAADADAPIAAVMTADPFTVPPEWPALRVAEALVERDLNAVPVVATEGQLVGIVTIDAALALLAPEAWRERVPRVFA
jgi:CBS domain-containing protein